MADTTPTPVAPISSPVAPDNGGGQTATGFKINNGIKTYVDSTGNAVADQASGYKQLYGTDMPAKSSPSLIVTSGDSRATYATNETNLKNTTAGMANSNPSVVDFLNNNKMPSDFNSRASLAKQYGIEGYTGSADQNTQLLQKLQNGGKNDTTIDKPADTTGKEENGTGSNTGSGTTNDGTTKGIDPVLQNQFTSAISDLDTQISNAKSTLSSALSTLQNDPAATSAVNMIMSKYDQQIQLMKDKNRMVLGRATVNSARSGMMQYANDMNSSFMSYEQDRASQRVADLITTEMNMVLKTQEAYKKGDVAAFNAASKNLETAQKGKISAISKLLDETDKAIKTQQAQAKIDASSAKNATANDIKLSTSLATSIADEIQKSGITDEKKIDAYINAMASKSGIGNVDILRSAVVKARQSQTKFDLSTKNTEDIINKRGSGGGGGSTGKGGTDGSYKYSAKEVSDATDFLNNGNKETGYNGRGDDGFVDPSAYVALYKNWIKQGGTPQGFTKKFPTSNISPDDYSTLPKAIQPSLKSGKKQFG